MAGSSKFPKPTRGAVAAPAPGMAEPHTVVLVEDDAALAKALGFTLAIDGFAVLFCPSGEALLAATLPSGRFCIVCDLRLPGVSGLEALRALRGRGVHEPAILITGDPSVLERAAAARVHARLVQKPLVDGELLRAIREALA